MRVKVSTDIAKKIDDLFVYASIKEEEKLVKKARDFAKHSNYRIPDKWKDKFCDKCNSWFNSRNSKIRLSKGKITKECLKCGYISRKRFKTS